MQNNIISSSSSQREECNDKSKSAAGKGKTILTTTTNKQQTHTEASGEPLPEKETGAIQWLGDWVGLSTECTQLSAICLLLLGESLESNDRRRPVLLVDGGQKC